MNLSSITPEMGVTDGKNAEKHLFSSPEIQGKSFDSVLKDLARHSHNSEVPVPKARDDSAMKSEGESQKSDDSSSNEGAELATDSRPTDFAILEDEPIRLPEGSTQTARSEDKAQGVPTRMRADAGISDVTVQSQPETDQRQPQRPSAARSGTEAIHSSFVITEDAELSSPPMLAKGRSAEISTGPQASPHVFSDATSKETLPLTAGDVPDKKPVEPARSDRQVEASTHVGTNLRSEQPAPEVVSLNRTASPKTPEAPAGFAAMEQTTFQASPSQVEPPTSEESKFTPERGPFSQPVPTVNPAAPPVNKEALPAEQIAPSEPHQVFEKAVSPSSRQTSVLAGGAAQNHRGASLNIETTAFAPSEGGVEAQPVVRATQPDPVHLSPTPGNPTMATPQGNIAQNQYSTIIEAAEPMQPTQTSLGMRAGSEPTGAQTTEETVEKADVRTREWSPAKSPQTEKSPLPATPPEAAIETLTAFKPVLGEQQILAEPTVFEREVEAMAVAQGPDVVSTQTIASARGVDTQSANVARQVVQQLAENALTTSGKVEISLSPEELGRVRLTASQTDQGVVLVVQAERPETLDLMRRHLPDLMQDLRDMGFGDVSYSDQHQQQNQEKTAGSVGADAAPTEEREIQMVQASGLDLRL